MDSDPMQDDESFFSSATLTEGVTKMEIQFTKIDEEKRLVSGWASVIEKNGEPVVDHQGDVISEEDLCKAAHDFMREYRIGKTMHHGSQTTEIVESVVFTKALQQALGIDLGQVGWFIVTKVLDDATWTLVKSKDLRAFSIGGTGQRVPIVAKYGTAGRDGDGDGIFDEDGSGSGGADIKTQNEGYGFHMSAYNGADVDEDEANAAADKLFSTAVKEIALHTGASHEQARDFLDSTNGRHFGDQVKEFTRAGIKSAVTRYLRPPSSNRGLRRGTAEQFGIEWAGGPGSGHSSRDK